MPDPVTRVKLSVLRTQEQYFHLSSYIRVELPNKVLRSWSGRHLQHFSIWVALKRKTNGEGREGSSPFCQGFFHLVDARPRQSRLLSGEAKPADEQYLVHCLLLLRCLDSNPDSLVATTTHFATDIQRGQSLAGQPPCDGPSIGDEY